MSYILLSIILFFLAISSIFSYPFYQPLSLVAVNAGTNFPVSHNCSNSGLIYSYQQVKAFCSTEIKIITFAFLTIYWDSSKGWLEKDGDAFGSLSSSYNGKNLKTRYLWTEVMLTTETILEHLSALSLEMDQKPSLSCCYGFHRGLAPRH